MYVGVKQLFNKVKSSLLPSFGSYISESKTYFLPLIFKKPAALKGVVAKQKRE